MPGFEYRRNLDGSIGAPTLLRQIGKNSVVFTVGDMVRINTSGFVDIVDADEDISGVCVGVVDTTGKAIDSDSGTIFDYTMASDNQTSAKKEVVFIPALPHYLFYNDSSGTLAQTDVLKCADLADQDQVDQSSLADSQKQVQLVVWDPDGDADASKGLFRVVETHLGSVQAYRAA
jgi:hypothetical protein